MDSLISVQEVSLDEDIYTNYVLVLSTVLDPADRPDHGRVRRACTYIRSAATVCKKMATEGSHWAPVRHLDFGHSIAELEDHVSKLVAFVTEVISVLTSKERRSFSCEHYGTRYSVDTSGTRLKPLARPWTPRGLPAASKPKRARPAPEVVSAIPQTAAEKCWRAFSSTPVKTALLRLLAETCQLPEADAVVRATRLLKPQDAGWPATVPPPDGKMHAITYTLCDMCML